MRRENLLKHIGNYAVIEKVSGIGRTVYRVSFKNGKIRLIYVKESNSLKDPFWGVSENVLDKLAGTNFCVVLLDDMNKNAYIYDENQLYEVIEDRDTNKVGNYLLHEEDVKSAFKIDEVAIGILGLANVIN